MGLPIIIVTKNEQVRAAAILDLLKEYNLKEEHPDVLFLREKLGIEAIKKVAHHLSWKPTLSQNRAVVIDPADQLTPDAQNGLLKTLEEPSEKALIFLGVAHEDSLLATVISRCEVRIIQEGRIHADDVSFVDTLIKKEIPDRLESIEKIEDRKKLLQDLVDFYHQQMQTNAIDVQSGRILLQAEKWVKQNVSAKAVTDFLMVALPKQ